MLQHVAVCCTHQLQGCVLEERVIKVLLYVAVCCSMLQRVTVCCTHQLQGRVLEKRILDGVTRNSGELLLCRLQVCDMTHSYVR